MEISDVQLMAYADGELDAETMRAVEAVLGGDPQAHAKVEMFRQTGDLLRAACAEGFYASGLEHLRIPSGRPKRSIGRRFAALAAACLVAGLVGFGGGKLSSLPGSARDSLLDEVAEYHAVFSREDAHLVEVSAANSAELQDWLGQRLGRSLPPPDLSKLGLSFAGGRMLVIDGKPVGELMYVRQSGPPVALCVTRMAGAAEPLRVDTRQDLRLASWTDGQHAYVAVGLLDAQAVTDVAEMAAAQLKG